MRQSHLPKLTFLGVVSRLRNRPQRGRPYGHGRLSSWFPSYFLRGNVPGKLVQIWSVHLENFTMQNLKMTFKGISTSKGEKISWFVSGACWESVVFHTQRLFLGSTGIPCHFFPSTRNQPKCLQILTQISVVGQFVHEPNNEKLPTNTPSQKQPSRLRPSRPNTSYPPET